jgi:hypothetical protein
MKENSGGSREMQNIISGTEFTQRTMKSQKQKLREEIYFRQEPRLVNVEDSQELRVPMRTYRFVQ